MKRVFDILICVIALVVLAPILLLITCVLRLSGEGEIFYVQQRAGRGGKPFGLYKFATMLKNSPNIGAGDITVQDDPRVLPFGRFLRKTKLNELPQLLNILRGEMSLVGPRPMVLDTYATYPIAARQKLDLIRPGLTGVGSIVFRDEERYLADRENPMDFYKSHIIPYKVELELWFFENNTLWTYIKIIFITGWVVLFPASKMVEKAFDGLPALPPGLNLG